MQANEAMALFSRFVNERNWKRKIQHKKFKLIKLTQNLQHIKYSFDPSTHMGLKLFGMKRTFLHLYCKPRSQRLQLSSSSEIMISLSFENAQQ